MSNYYNIKPYAEMVHAAAQHGGPASYLDRVATYNYRAGYLKGTGNCLACSFAAGVFSILIWEGIKYGYKCTKEHQEKVNAAIEEARAAQKECLRVLNREEQPPQT